MSNARFSILQARAVSDSRISDAQFRTLAALGMYADKDGWCFPSLTRIGADCNKKKQAAGRDIIHLKKCGYVEVYPQFDQSGGRKVNKYRLIFDPPVNNGYHTPSTSEVDTPSTSEVDTPSTSEVDTPSTSEVDVNDPINVPKKKNGFSELPKTDETKGDYITQADQKVNFILENEKRITERNSWEGRAFFRPDHLPLVDWYHERTGQTCPKSKQKDWMRALLDWTANNLTVADLQVAYEMDIIWRGVFTSPNQLTEKAIAIKAQKKTAKSKPQAPEIEAWKKELNLG